MHSRGGDLDAADQHGGLVGRHLRLSAMCRLAAPVRVGLARRDLLARSEPRAAASLSQRAGLIDRTVIDRGHFGLGEGRAWLAALGAVDRPSGGA
jgi:hypothetical protein